MQNKTNLNPVMLTWAREQAGLSVADVAGLARISPLKSKKGVEGKSSAERLIDWESGVEFPTFSQLQALAKVFQRPIMTFFLAKPPVVSTKLDVLNYYKTTCPILPKQRGNNQLNLLIL